MGLYEYLVIRIRVQYYVQQWDATLKFSTDVHVNSNGCVGQWYIDKMINVLVEQ